jgi:hypothetical protein
MFGALQLKTRRFINQYTIHLRMPSHKLKKISRNIVNNTKNNLNINKYNKFLFIFETILFVGVIDEFFEGLIMQIDNGIYLNILLLMFSIGILFYIALQFIERVAKGAIIWVVRLNNNKLIRLFVHIIILSFLYYLYAQVFFDTTIALNFNIGLTAS